MAQHIKLILPLFLMFLAISGPAYSLAPWDEASSSAQDSENLAGLLGEQKLTWREVKTIEDKKDAVLARIDEVLREKNESILGYQKLIYSLEKKLRDQELSFKDKLVGEYEKRELASIIEAKAERISDLEGQITKLDLQVEVMKKQFIRQDTQFRYQLTRLKKNYQEVFEKIAQGEAELPAGMAMKLTSYQIELEKFFDSGLNPAADTSSTALEKRVAASEETVQGLLKTNRDLVSELRKVENENANLKREIGTLHEELANVKQESASWQRVAQELKIELKNTERKLQIAKVDFEGEKANLISQFNDITEVEKTVGRTPASTPAENSDHADIVSGAFMNVTAKLVQAQIKWSPIFESGTVSIRVNDYFYFNKDSYVLTEVSKDKLHTLMEIYATEIFGNEELRQKIDSIEFIGHSSPWYQGEVVEPTLKYPAAFEYNMKLSIERAREVVSYVFDGDFIDFPHKEEFRSKMKVSGQGHTAPVSFIGPNNEQAKPTPFRELASEPSSQCGAYDCDRSRRLEIVIHFR